MSILFPHHFLNIEKKILFTLEPSKKKYRNLAESLRDAEFVGPSTYHVCNLGGEGVWQNSTLAHEGVGLETTWTHVPLNLQKIY